MKPCRAHHVHVEHVAEVADVGQDEILLVRGGGLHRRRERHARHAGVPVAQQRVGAILDPAGDIGVGRPAVRRVVLEAAVLGWIVRRGNDDAIGEVHRGDGDCSTRMAREITGVGRDTVVLLDDGLDPVGGEHLERGALRRRGEGVRVLPEVERAVDAALAPVLTDRLGDGQDVCFSEGAVERGAAMPAGAEGDLLRRVVRARGGARSSPARAGRGRRAIRAVPGSRPAARSCQPGTHRHWPRWLSARRIGWLEMLIRPP